MILFRANWLLLICSAILRRSNIRPLNGGNVQIDNLLSKADYDHSFDDFPQVLS